jgi:hypothetical protein
MVSQIRDVDPHQCHNPDARSIEPIYTAATEAVPQSAGQVKVSAGSDQSTVMEPLRGGPETSSMSCQAPSALIKGDGECVGQAFVNIKLLTSRRACAMSSGWWRAPPTFFVSARSSIRFSPRCRARGPVLRALLSGFSARPEDRGEDGQL